MADEYWDNPERRDEEFFAAAGSPFDPHFRASSTPEETERRRARGRKIGLVAAAVLAALAGGKQAHSTSITRGWRAPRTQEQWRQSPEGLAYRRSLDWAAGGGKGAPPQGAAAGELLDLNAWFASRYPGGTWGSRGMMDPVLREQQIRHALSVRPSLGQTRFDHPYLGRVPFVPPG